MKIRVSDDRLSICFTEFRQDLSRDYWDGMMFLASEDGGTNTYYYKGEEAQHANVVDEVRVRLPRAPSRAELKNLIARFTEWLRESEY